MLEARMKQEITEEELKLDLEEYNEEIELINNDIIRLQQERVGADSISARAEMDSAPTISINY